MSDVGDGVWGCRVNRPPCRPSPHLPSSPRLYLWRARAITQLFFANTSFIAKNTGRWTNEEHGLFLRGLDLHGKGWKKIASLIRTRTVVQIRTHAQKYFQKLAKAQLNGDHGGVDMDKGGYSGRKRMRG